MKNQVSEFETIKKREDLSPRAAPDTATAGANDSPTPKPGHCNFSPCDLREKDPWLKVSSQTRRDKKEWRFRDRRCRSLGGLRRRHAPPPGAGAPHGGRHGTTRTDPPVCKTASFIMPPPPDQTCILLWCGALALGSAALRDRPPPQCTASMTLLRPGTTCPQSTRARSSWHLETYPTF